ncbi:MAG: ATP-binding protein, partial [Ardenticatenaceae bacterium]
QSLSGAIEWSYDLLSPDERRLFEQLGVFAGGCDEEVIADVDAMLEGGRSGIPDGAGKERSVLTRRLLSALVEKSLLQYALTAEGAPRYQMLESLREYALEKLHAAGRLEAARLAHAEHYLRLALAARPHLTGGEQQRWLNQLELEHNNLRAALAWATETPGRGEFALTLAEAMWNFWNIRGYLSEGRRWLEKALALSETASELRGRALSGAGWLAQLQGDYSTAQRLQEQALADHELLDDEPGMCRSLEHLAILAGRQDNYPRTGELLERSLAIRRRLGDLMALVPPLSNLGIVNRRLGNLARAEELYREGADLCRALGNQKSLSHTQHGLAEIRAEQGDDAGALALFRECIAIRHRLGNRTELTNSLFDIAIPLSHLGDDLTAARLMSAAAKLRADLGVAESPTNHAESEKVIAAVRAQVGATIFKQAWAAGQTMSLDEAVALALGGTA